MASGHRHLREAEMESEFQRLGIHVSSHSRRAPASLLSPPLAHKGHPLCAKTDRRVLGPAGLGAHVHSGPHFILPFLYSKPWLELQGDPHFKAVWFVA